MYANPMQAYNSISSRTSSGREVEAAVLTKAANKLKSCQNNWDDGGHEARLDEALKYNQRLWSIFQGELSREDNPLPSDVRNNLVVLGAFVDKRIFETMAFPSPEKLDIVISINQNIAAGLRSSAVDN